MPINTHYKQPSETYPIAVDFAGKLPAGTAILSGTCTARNEAGTDASAEVLDGPCVVDGDMLLQKLAGGTSGQRYDLTFQATLTPGSYLLEEDVALFVREE